MKMKNRWFTIFSFLLIMFFTSCSSAVNKAEKTATLFYYYAMRQDFNSIIPLLDEQMIQDVPAQKWINTLTQIQMQRGAINKYNPTKVEVFKDTTGNLLVRFRYKVRYDNSTHTEELVLIQRHKKSPFKVLKYTYNYQMK